ncbi:hypothetical protein D3C76_1242940 [compost metagenome]
MIKQITGGKLLPQPAPGDQAMIDCVHMDGNDSSIRGIPDEAHHILLIHRNGVANDKPGTSCVYDRHLGAMGIEGRFHFITPNGVSREVERGFLLGLPDKAGNPAHSLTDFPCPMLAGGAMDGDSSEFYGAMNLRNIGKS